jgi:hypothetical protein
MHNLEQRYERSGKAKPCSLDQEDLITLSHLIQETFTRPEIERYFRVSTTLGNTRVFSNSMADFLVQKDLPEKLTDLSFWIEGWGHQTRFDKNVLLDFSRYSVRLHVEGIDPVWVFDKYNKITEFLQHKTVWYWPIIVLERFIMFSMTVILIISLMISYHLKDTLHFVSKIGFLGAWVFLMFVDTRKIWPYSSLQVKGKRSLISRENLFMVAILSILVMVVLEGAIVSLIK